MWLALWSCGLLLCPHPVLAIEQRERDGATWSQVSAVHGYAVRVWTPAAAIGTYHAWRIQMSSGGQPFPPERLQFDARMPNHGHGSNAHPQVVVGADGDWTEVQGVRFNMPGFWQITLRFIGPRGPDSLRIDVQQPLVANNAGNTASAGSSSSWSALELQLLESLSLPALPAAADPSNRWFGNPLAQALGKRLFHDPALSASGRISCASCHLAAHGFADHRALSLGSKPTKRHSPSLLGSAHSEWFYWDGSRDSLWAQALTPLERLGEMDNNRATLVRTFLKNPEYRRDYERVLSSPLRAPSAMSLPDAASPLGNKTLRLTWHRLPEETRGFINRHFVALGKLLASYVATLQHVPTRFDRFVRELRSEGQSDALTKQEVAGMKLYLRVEQSQCLRCHNGPLFSNQGFHNVGSAEGKLGTDLGRALGLPEVLADPFNCMGAYSDAQPDQCAALLYAKRLDRSRALSGAFKVPSLRGLGASAPYFHDGRFRTLSEVLDHYQRLPASEELKPIRLSAKEQGQLLAFLQAL